MTKENITIDDLARMVQKGFEETVKKEEVDLQFKGVNERLDKVEDSLESIEKLILADHKQRIETLEEKVKELRELLAVK